MKTGITGILTALAMLAAGVFNTAFASDCTFADSEGEWFEESVEYVYSLGLIDGYEDGLFHPSDNVTVAQLSAILYRMSDNESASSLFAGNGYWADGYIIWASLNNLYSGFVSSMEYLDYYAQGLDKLGERPLTREQVISMIYQYGGEEAGRASLYFDDADSISEYAVPAAAWGYANGIIQGDDSGCFNPGSLVTRAEAAAILERFIRGGRQEPETSAAPVSSSDVKGGVSENGKLQVIGTQLCNEAGEPVVLHGMSSHGLHWFPQFTSREYIKMTADSGANVFRAAMYTGEGGYISQPETVKNLLITAVDNAIAEDMYVIVDWHILSDGNPMTYIEQSKSFFDEISARYGNTPNVLYEICNEPNGSISWAGDIKPYAEAVIPVIRQNAPESIVLVGSGTWSQDINEAADNPLTFENVMYTCHFYAGTHGQWLRDRIDYALSNGAPVFVSEWGTSAADGNGGVFVNETNEWLDFLDTRGISWCNWSLCDKAESSAALTAGGGLSESGELVFGRF